MCSFEYVSKAKWKPIKKELVELIHYVQDEIREDFTFRYDFVGSSKRNMITYDTKSNIGFDFDVDIEVNDDDESYSAKEIKQKLMNAFNRSRYRLKTYYNSCEDSTRVFTIKMIDHQKSRVIHSCDFAIVYNCSDGSQQYIRHNKSQNNYFWSEQTKRFSDLTRLEKAIKKHGLWNKVKDLYIDKKNKNTNIYKKSRSLYAETIHEVYQLIKWEILRLSQKYISVSTKFNVSSKNKHTWNRAVYKNKFCPSADNNQ